MPNLGVFPVFSNKFSIGTKGMASAAPGDMSEIANIESFSPSIDSGVEEWTPLDSEGWRKCMMTAKSMTVSVSGKRTYGDKGNDYLAGLALKSGQDTMTKIEWTLPNGDRVKFDAVVSVSTIGGGDSTGIDALEAEFMSNGKLVYEPASEMV